MNDQRLYTIIIGPHTTEKSVRASAANQHVFKVALDATKHELALAVEKLFNVKVISVRTANAKGKKKQFRQREGERSNWKKAYVRLAEGHDINLANFQ